MTMSIQRIADVWGAAITDLNFTSHPPGGPNIASDFRELSAKMFVDWHVAVHSNRLAWCWIKWQSGHAAFPSRFLPPMKHLSQDFYRDYCRLAEAAGMYTLGYTCGGDDQQAAAEHPEWFEHYGAAWACLNADPFWEREFNAIREALQVYPTRGLFYDMVRFDGACRCLFCQAAYERFYGQPMPVDVDRQRFRRNTFSHWLDRAIAAPREVAPDIEVCVNQQWMRSDGIPLEMLDRCDWYYCEYGEYEWVGEIMRAWADRPLVCGNAMEPRHVAHLAARRASPIAYDVLHDAETGRLLPLTDPRVQHWSDSLSRIRAYENYLSGAVAIPHCAVLFDHERTCLPTEEAYSQDVASHIRLLAESSLTSTCVQRMATLDDAALARYEALFAPGLNELDPAVLPSLLRWVENGGTLYVDGLLAGAGAPQAGGALPDLPWLGLTNRGGPLRTFADILELDAEGQHPIDEMIRVDRPVSATAASATPLLYAHVGARGRQPIVWQNRLGQGRVIYLAGRWGKRINQGAGVRQNALRRIFRDVICRELRRAPVVTSLAYPAEVWLNRQPDQGRLVLHLLTFEGAPEYSSVSIRSDLIAGAELLQVYPDKGSRVPGRREGAYTVFEFHALPEHAIFTVPAAEVPQA